MIFDKQNLFSDKQVATADAKSEQTVDFYKGDIRETPYVDDTPRDLGRGTPVPIRVQLVADAAAEGLVIEVNVSDTVVSGDLGGTIVKLGELKIAGKKAGDWAEGQFLPHSDKYQRYMQLTYKAAATVTAGIVDGHDQRSPA